MTPEEWKAEFLRAVVANHNMKNVTPADAERAAGEYPDLDPIEAAKEFSAAFWEDQMAANDPTRTTVAPITLQVNEHVAAVSEAPAPRTVAASRVRHVPVLAEVTTVYRVGDHQFESLRDAVDEIYLQRLVELIRPEADMTFADAEEFARFISVGLKLNREAVVKLMFDYNVAFSDAAAAEKKDD